MTTIKDWDKAIKSFAEETKGTYIYRDLSCNYDHYMNGAPVHHWRCHIISKFYELLFNLGIYGR